MEPHQLDNLYKKYGFNRIITPKDYQVRAYSLRTGYFLNADIVNFGSVEDAEKAKRNLEENGFACTIRNYKTIEEANKLLFDGFFATESHKKRLGLEYKKFQEKSSKAIHGSYEYISARFTSSKELETPQIEIIKYISELLSKDGPILIILEAAAGYGKTCTSFEVLNSLLSQDTGKIPIMTEFSLTVVS